MTSYKVASQEGADFAGNPAAPVEVGATVDLDLDKEQERAVLAAGWLEETKKKKES